MSTTATLPPPLHPGRYRIAMVCLGNICRSPVAEVVTSARIAEAGLDDVVEVFSAGTADYHVGKSMDPRSAETLTSAGYDATRHRAQQFQHAWHDDVDLILVMDHSNHDDVTRGAERDRVRLFRDFDPEFPGEEVPDPYYGGEDGFREVLSMVERTSAHLVELVAGVVDR
ncbi:low molecular weight protein-tyrosine-phosphatase [Nocardioides daphniae]|uniref:protein-tyrosine-phosphatase n=1 Tax=Nocardioides daphniae TaxID=402297 RepID=A0A4P7U886_9ACTN|nr:low molecular weight protein-tyrosine-phosphatase [Nocardioides daphniae]QCC76216.1 low molecular weight phosphotyrosine protein phosphatase [Nocardioides daphniae]GGD08900.1 low molecular weight protein-tyrosine-phosphatase [Nocardioides daphniae]